MDVNRDLPCGIRQFAGDDYDNWKFRLRSVLRMKKVLIVLDETKPTNEKELESWNEAEDRAQSIIIACISDSHLIYIQKDGIQTAKDMIQALDATFAKKSVSSRMYLMNQVLNLRMDELDTMECHLRKFDEMFRKLKTAGSQLDEVDEVCCLLRTLPPSYGPLITALETLAEEKLTKEFVRNRLMDQELKFKQETVMDKDSDHVAFATKKLRNVSQSKDGSSSQSNFPFRCHSCGKRGHKAADCRRNRGRNVQSSNVERLEEDDTDDECPPKVSFLIEVEANQCKVGNHSTNEFTFWLDSGCTDHMVMDEFMLYERKKVNQPIQLADEGVVSATLCGRVSLFFNDFPMQLDNVLYSQRLRRNLLSVDKLKQAGIGVDFPPGDNAAILYRKTKGNSKEILGIAERKGNLYKMILRKGICSANLTSVKSNSADLLHRRLGHASNDYLSKLINNKLCYGLDGVKSNWNDERCGACLAGRQRKLPFKHRLKSRSRRPLDLIHTDLCMVEQATYDGKRYFMSFIDDYTHFTIVYLLKQKSEAFSCLKDYVNRVTAHFNSKVNVVRCDRGGEYRSKVMRQWCREQGIKVQYTMGYTPQHNGVAERMNATIVQKARSMMYEANLPTNFWGEAVYTAVYLINRLPTEALNFQSTPAEQFYDKKPNLSHLRIFGCLASRLKRDHERETKMHSKTENCIFLGYYETGYRLWSVKDKKVKIAKDVEFFEAKLGSVLLKRNESRSYREEGILIDVSSGGEFCGIHEEPSLVGDCSGADRCVETPREGGDGPVDNEHLVDDQRREVRLRGPPAHLKDYVVTLNNVESVAEGAPNTYKEACESGDAVEWRAAMEKEMQAMERNGVWTLVDYPPGQQVIKSRWVFAVKTGGDGTVIRKKARLVAKGCMQRDNFDFFDKYSPTASLDTVRIFLIIINHYDLEALQLDVSAAFLYGCLDTPVYMSQPEGFNGGPNGSKVCKLNKAIYGLRQASKCWYETFHNFLLQLKFCNCVTEPCFYFRRTETEFTCLLVYVDDCILASNNSKQLGIIKDLLCERFEMSKINNLENSSFIGLEITRNVKDQTLTIGQQEYIRQLLRKYDMENCHTVGSPMEHSLDLSSVSNEIDRQDFISHKYRSLMGSLIYLSRGTRPDISFSVNYLTRFQENPSQVHLQHAKRILRYLKGTINLSITYSCKKFDFPLVAYCDADFAGDRVDRKSTSGSFFFLFGNLASWSSRKQTIVTLSSTEAEYVSLSSCARDCVSLRNFLSEINVIDDNFPVHVYEDSQNAIGNAKTVQNRNKHIDIKFHYVKDAVKRRCIEISYVPTNRQIADILTKALPVSSHSKFIEIVFNV
jgi:transposase InsO family protein